jgi:Predicted membrane protein
MAAVLKDIWRLLKKAGGNWISDKAPRLGAALSYYTVFAIPPLFVIILFLVSLIMDPDKVQAMLFSEVGGLVGEKSSEAIQAAMTAQMNSSKGLFASIIAIATLVVTATGLFIELQDALNTIWGVREKPGQGILGFIRNRLLSFAMVVGIGFLLLVSLVVSAGLSAFGKYMSALVPGLDVLWMVTNAAVSFAVITLLFAMVFKFLPDVKIRWRDVWVGAAVTAALFTVGKFALGFYIGRSTAVSAYGAAGSIVLILLWVYYSAQILFFGAEITEVYANRHGRKLEPTSNAEWADTTVSGKPASKSKSRPETDTRPVDQKERLVASIRREVESLRELVEK